MQATLEPDATPSHGLSPERVVNRVGASSTAEELGGGLIREFTAHEGTRERESDTKKVSRRPLRARRAGSMPLGYSRAGKKASPPGWPWGALGSPDNNDYLEAGGSGTGGAAAAAGCEGATTGAGGAASCLGGRKPFLRR